MNLVYLMDRIKITKFLSEVRDHQLVEIQIPRSGFRPMILIIAIDLAV